mgnify:CR=1 FL=1
MDLINQFIDNYKKKFNYYESVGRLAAGQLELCCAPPVSGPWLPTGPKSGTLKKQGSPPQCQAPGSLPEYKGNL